MREEEVTYHVDVPRACEAPVYVHGIHDDEVEMKRRGRERAALSGEGGAATAQ